ncbi:MAG TPA: TIGR03668 family PPOX class F420-dependent oxidoreductase [Acidimicrobiia bacterium]|nr:TIGR03668 family PPOX class F420-dependent oxidoreductase [Acidimicrobiia bacterium]
MDDVTARARLEGARVGELATVRADGTPHVVPVCFAVAGTAVVTAVDGKPKSTGALRRLENVRANPRASVLVHAYDDRDWTRLWWVRVDGRAEVVAGGPAHAAAVDLLAAKYAQYRDSPPAGPVIRLTIDRWASWSWRA